MEVMIISNLDTAAFEIYSFIIFISVYVFMYSSDNVRFIQEDMMFLEFYDKLDKYENFRYIIKY